MTSVDTPTEPAMRRPRAGAAPRRAGARRVPWFSPENVVIGAGEPHRVRGRVPRAVGVRRRPLVRLVLLQHAAAHPSRRSARELVDPGFYRDLGVTALEMGVGFAIGAGGGIGARRAAGALGLCGEGARPVSARALQHSARRAGADADRVVRHRLFVEDLSRRHAGVLHHLLQHAVRHPQRRQGAVRHRAGACRRPSGRSSAR